MPITAMIDSGSVLTTISPRTVEKLGLETTAKRNDIQIRNADGSLMKEGWKESVRAYVNTGVSQGNMELAVLETTEDKFLLGNDWIARYKPKIDWETGTVTTKYGETKLLGTRNMLVIDRSVRSKRMLKRPRKKVKFRLHNDSDAESESDNEIGLNFE